jgi:hypothetical protein
VTDRCGSASHPSSSCRSTFRGRRRGGRRRRTGRRRLRRSRRRQLAGLAASCYGRGITCVEGD